MKRIFAILLCALSVARIIKFVPTKTVTIAVAHELTHSTPTKQTTSKAVPKVSKYKTLNAWIVAFENQESGRGTRLKILDDNGKYSYCCLQFQHATLTAYAVRYGLRTQIIVEDIFNYHLQKQTTKLMLANNPKNWRHWYNSVRKIGNPPPVDNLGS